MNYESTIIVPSDTRPGVSYVVAKLSFGRRLALMRSVRELSGKLEFHRAGSTEADRMEAAILSSEIDRLYVEWGLVEVCGLTIDGEIATPGMLGSAGPEALFAEALAAVQKQLSLTEQERKN